MCPGPPQTSHFLKVFCFLFLDSPDPDDPSDPPGLFAPLGVVVGGFVLVPATILDLSYSLQGIIYSLQLSSCLS